MAFESRYMQHCLGQFDNLKELTDGYAEYYVTQKEQGLYRYFSLRDHFNKPHVTISLEWDGEYWCIEQIKGKQNEVPIKKYADDVLLFLNHFKPRNNYNSDCTAMGIVCKSELDGSSEQQQLENSDQHYVYFYNLDDAGQIESLLFENFQLFEHYDQQNKVIQHVLIGFNKTEFIQEPVEKYISTILNYDQQDDQFDYLDLNIEFEEEPETHPVWKMILKPYFMMIHVLHSISKMPLIGWIVKLILYLIAIPWVLLSAKKDQSKQWMLATGDLIYLRNKINWYGVKTLKLDHFDEFHEIYKKHVYQVLNINEKKKNVKEKQIHYFLKHYFQIYRSYNFYLNNPKQSKTFYRDALVFSHIQKIFMIRLLAHFNDIQEEVAWQYITASAKIIQDCCSNWNDMGDKYVKGRELYLMSKYSDYENYDQSAQQDLNYYLELQPNNWSVCKWDTDLLIDNHKKKAI